MGATALFIDPSAGSVLHYSGLRAWDAAGRDLEASLALEDGRLAIRVDDRQALYPVCVDPWIATEEAKLVAGDPDPTTSARPWTWRETQP